jgi:hypothetical protein
VFRSFKSAGVLITLLVLSCVLGTMIIQDLDLRRADVFDPGLAPEGRELPVFDDNNQSTRFAIAQSSLLVRLPGLKPEQRQQMLEQRVKLSDMERKQVELRAEVFGRKNADAYRDAVLASKERQVNHITTSDFAKKNHKQLYDFYLFCRSLHLFDIFESWWFALLLALIAVNVIVGTIVRAPWGMRDLGVAITHAGILIVLAGAVIDWYLAKEGYIYFSTRTPEERMAWKIEDRKNQVYHHLPFRVRLDRFATEYYHELYIERFDWSRRSDGRPVDGSESAARPFSVFETFPVRSGVPLVFDNGRVQVKVHEYKPRVLIDTVIEDDPSAPPNPALKLGLYAEPRGGANFIVQSNAEPWLFANDPMRTALSLYNARFEYVRARSENEFRRLLAAAPMPDNGTLILQAEGEHAVRIPVVLGATRVVRIGQQALDIDFLAIRSAIGDAKNVNLDERMQMREEPVLVLHVDGSTIEVPRDDHQFLSGFDLLGGIDFRFDWPNPKDQGVRRVFRLVDGPNQPLTLVQLDAAGLPATAEVGPGRPPVALEGIEGAWLGVEAVAARAVEKRAEREVTDLEFLERGGGAEDALLAAWADVEFHIENGRTERLEMTPYDEPFWFDFDPQGRPRYVFRLVKTRMARDWFSVLSVLDHDDEVVASHAVQVNSPLRYGGFRFFQATAATDADGFGRSGISVTKNPGVSFMYLGYTVLTLGTCWIFFLKPILDRRRRRRRTRVAAVEGAQS